MKRKTFKIGEYAVGGKIKILIKNKTIVITALDWYKDTNIISARYLAYEPNARYNIKGFLNELTTHYYAEKILEWIESKIELENEMDYVKHTFSLN